MSTRVWNASLTNHQGIGLMARWVNTAYQRYHSTASQWTGSSSSRYPKIHSPEQNMTRSWPSWTGSQDTQSLCRTFESSSTEALAYSFCKTIIADHDMPKVIISDKDKWLTSNFWKSLMKKFGSKQMMTSAYHPQANGQAERLNQTLEQYLRHYLNENKITG
jgi:hypothetical protein